MNFGAIFIDPQDLTAQGREALAVGGPVGEMLTRRLKHCGASLRRLSPDALLRLVRGHLRDILEVPPLVGAWLPGRSGDPSVAVDDVDRKYWHILERVPVEQRDAVRERLRRGMARDRGV